MQAFGDEERVRADPFAGIEIPLNKMWVPSAPPALKACNLVDVDPHCCMHTRPDWVWAKVLRRFDWLREGIDVCFSPR